MTTIKYVNVETGAEIEREMNAEELAQWEIDKAKAEAEAQAKADAEVARIAAEEQVRLQAEAKAAIKAAAFTRLGLTEEEINAFLA